MRRSIVLRLSTVDLLVLTSSDQRLFTLKILFTFFTIQATLMWRSTVPRLSTVDLLVLTSLDQLLRR